MTATYVTGDVFDCLAATPDGSVDLVLTSPPFLALRSYLPADHPNKGKEIGQEPTPAGFVDTLLALSAEFRRVLAPHGSIAVELGDTYSGSGGAGGDYADDGMREGQGAFRQSRGDGWPEAKSACLIPELYRVALAYGLNPITGDPSPAGRWRVRNTIRWCRPNPPVGALGDKFRPATSDMVIACLDTEGGRKRYFDLDAVRGDPVEPSERRVGDAAAAKPGGGDERVGPDGTRPTANPAGAPPLDWWEVSTEAYSGSHYATWPRKLLTRPIKSMCPQKVCMVCGEPSRRIVGAYTLDAYRQSTRTQTIRAVQLADEHGLTDEHIAAIRAFGTSDAGKAIHLNDGAGKNTDEVKRLAAEAKAVLGGYFREFVMTTEAQPDSSWTDCGHDAWRNGIVLDPFAGSGTTLAVATGHGRDALGFDLDERNVELAAERIGPLLMSAITLDEYRAERRSA